MRLSRHHKRHSLSPRLWLAACLALATWAGGAHAAWVKADAGIMGTNIHVEAWHEDSDRARHAVDAVLSELRHVDTVMSPFKPDSELSRINRLAARTPVHISKELFDLIGQAMDFSKLTGGAFDITYASVGYMYDYRTHKHPDEAAIKKALPGVNYRHVKLDPKALTIRFTRPGMRIDLGGIAKGYAVEQSAAIMRSFGVEHGEITAGGDTRLVGDHLGWPWLVGIENPRDPADIVTRIPLIDSAVSTSGDYERFFNEDGVRYHHILDPTTGRSPDQVHSVTVIGPDGTYTDALSTSVFVLGVKKGLALIQQLPGYDAVIVDAHGDMHYSPGLAGFRNRGGAVAAAATDKTDGRH